MLIPVAAPCFWCFIRLGTALRIRLDVAWMFLCSCQSLLCSKGPWLPCFVTGLLVHESCPCWRSIQKSSLKNWPENPQGFVGFRCGRLVNLGSRVMFIGNRLRLAFLIDDSLMFQVCWDLQVERFESASSTVPVWGPEIAVNLLLFFVLRSKQLMVRESTSCWRSIHSSIFRPAW